MIATGESIRAIEELAKQAGAIVAAKAAILAELETARRSDVIFLKEHYVFRADNEGNYEPIRTMEEYRKQIGAQ